MRACVRAYVRVCHAYVFLVSHTSFWSVIAFGPDIKHIYDRMTSSKAHSPAEAAPLSDSNLHTSSANGAGDNCLVLTPTTPLMT